MDSTSMALLDRLKRDPDAAAAFVEEALQKSLPAGGSIERSSSNRWVVATERRDGLRCYEVFLDLMAFHLVITHGNTDAGAMSFEKLFEEATVIPLEGLLFVRMDLARCLEHLFATRSPNHLGQT